VERRGAGADRRVSGRVGGAGRRGAELQPQREAAAATARGHQSRCSGRAGRGEHRPPWRLPRTCRAGCAAFNVRGRGRPARPGGSHNSSWLGVPRPPAALAAPLRCGAAGGGCRGCCAPPRVFHHARRRQECSTVPPAWCMRGAWSIYCGGTDLRGSSYGALYRLDCTVVLYRILRSQSAACWLLDRLANSDMLLSSRCCMHECSGCWRGRAPCSVNVEILQAISYGEILGNRGSVLGHTILGSSGLLFCSYSCIDCS
jgi:hypothetical protein